MDGLGLKCHEIEEATTAVDILGMELCGQRTRVCCSAKRWWRIWETLGWTLKRRTLSGRQADVLVGHCTYVALLRRESLSISDGVNRSMSTNYVGQHKGWVNVRNELWTFRSLMLTLESSWEGDWSHDVLALDACMSGYAGVATAAPAAFVRSVGRVKERAIFKHSAHAQAREVALSRISRYEASDFVDDANGLELDLNFPETPVKLIRESTWANIVSGACYKHEISTCLRRALSFHLSRR